MPKDLISSVWDLESYKKMLLLNCMIALKDNPDSRLRSQVIDVYVFPYCGMIHLNR